MRESASWENGHHRILSEKKKNNKTVFVSNVRGNFSHERTMERASKNQRGDSYGRKAGVGSA